MTTYYLRALQLGQLKVVCKIRKLSFKPSSLPTNEWFQKLDHPETLAYTIGHKLQDGDSLLIRNYADIPHVELHITKEG